MKKISILLIISLLLALTSCSNPNKRENEMNQIDLTGDVGGEGMTYKQVYLDIPADCTSVFANHADIYTIITSYTGYTPTSSTIMSPNSEPLYALGAADIMRTPLMRESGC